MPAAEIDDAMVRFASGRGDVLLATNIIEAGLDVPRANTMIVWRADRFGLAQLHQLRGRVGRGNRRGHILLTTEPGASLTEATRKRLRTLESLDRLGAGFAISARDLDIRGAGDLVGDAQSGHMKLIGIDLYQHLLERAVREARGETLERWTPVINVGVGGRIPHRLDSRSGHSPVALPAAGAADVAQRSSTRSRTSSSTASARSLRKPRCCCASRTRACWRGRRISPRSMPARKPLPLRPGAR